MNERATHRLPVVLLDSPPPSVLSVIRFPLLVRAKRPRGLGFNPSPKLVRAWDGANSNSAGGTVGGNSSELSGEQGCSVL